MRAFWFMLAIIAINGGLLLLNAPLGTGGQSINQYVGCGNCTANMNLLNAPGSQSSSMTAKENQTILQQFASSFYIFGDIIGGISFFISFFANISFGVSITIAQLLPGTVGVECGIVVGAITSLVYIGGFVEMLAGRKVE